MTNDNRIVHGLWIGSELSRLEQLTLRSFARFGHEFHLWVYDDIETKLPVNVALRDANKILPRERIFRTKRQDAETGVGKGALPPFSDLFRYKLLYEYGGIWADMDVTCLRPLDFQEEYVFRPHRLGMVGNLMKCPKGSELMRSAFEEVDAIADEDIAWLAPNRILNRHVERLGLSRFIRRDISNEDHWLEVIRPYVESYAQIPDNWYVVHWVNEFWRTLKEENGTYRGRQVLDYIPDKDNPFPGSTLHELYRFYRLIDPWERPAAQTSAPASASSVRPDAEPARSKTHHINILLPTLVRGGAERTVVETVNALRWRSDTTISVHVLQRSQQQYSLSANERVRVTFHSDDRSGDPFRRIAMDVLASPQPLLFTHLIRTRHLSELWKLGVATVPVVHNARPGWLDSPTLYNDDSVPFVIACADAVAAQLRESGCDRPVVTLRHELQRRISAEELASARRRIRDLHGIADDTVLIGMVGQFKSQKAYTRAVRVLAGVQRFYKAKLLILGSWDHAYGSGRTAYEATMRLAVELGVVADLIVVGNVESVEPYLGAFDVFLNTSVYEGLSISLLEAIQAGTPVVSADAGGNREVMPALSALVEEGSDIDAYVEGIVRSVGKAERVLPTAPADPDLVPRIWPMLARHGIRPGTSHVATPRGALFITQNLHVGGPARAIVNLLTRTPKDFKAALCVLNGVSVETWHRDLKRAQVPVFSLENTPGVVDRAERILGWADALNVGSICFWNVAPELKLLLAKVLTVRPIKLVDVSPGPMLFDELRSAQDFQRRVSLSARGYFERLDTFVSLYKGGLAEPLLGATTRDTRIIPRGVPRPPRFVPLPPPEVMLPQRFDPAYAIGTCCRVVPDKRIEFLFEMMRYLGSEVPKATLTIVGGPDSKSLDYWEGLLMRVRDERLENIRFVGRHDEVNPFLAQFRVFVMVSDRQGCPNASLEAMAMGLPVVANADGGTAEQVIDGVAGFLSDQPARMAQRVAELLGNQALRRTMGAAARKIARERFSMERSVEAYGQLFGDSRVAEEINLG